MTRREAWVRFMAGAMAAGKTSEPAAESADAALDELDRRWPAATHNDNDRPAKVSTGIDKGAHGPPRYVGDPEPGP